jgi:hypothetical protein
MTGHQRRRIVIAISIVAFVMAARAALLLIIIAEGPIKITQQGVGLVIVRSILSYALIAVHFAHDFLQPSPSMLCINNDINCPLPHPERNRTLSRLVPIQKIPGKLFLALKVNAVHFLFF